MEKLEEPIWLVSFWYPLKTNKKVTYLLGSIKGILNNFTSDHDIIHNEVTLKDYDGKVVPSEKVYKEDWYDKICKKRISVKQIIYRRLKRPYTTWLPSGSGLIGIYSAYRMARRIDVYGWDFYFDVSPSLLNHFQMLKRMYNPSLDLLRSRNHLESMFVNLYYGYRFSKIRNVNIHGYMGQLDRHKKLIDRIERVLFND
jgi:hypothetical protein